MKKLAFLSVLFLFLLFFLPKNTYANPDRCEATNITSTRFTFCAGEFSSQSECLAHGLEIRTPGGSLECEEFFLFNTCAKDNATGTWFTCVDTSGVRPGCGSKDLDYRAKKKGFGSIWCELTVNLSLDQGKTIGSAISSAQNILCGKGIDTAIGCIPMGNTNEFIGFILGWAIGVGGGIAFLLMLFAGFQIMTSAGNPDRLRAGQELLTSAVSGLILLIFSVFILRVVGVNILGLFQ